MIFNTKHKKLSIFILLIFILLISMFLSILLGSVRLEPGEVISCLTGRDASSVASVLIHACLQLLLREWGFRVQA